MKALILAAGLGSRLRPLTDNVPKCMVEVNGVSIIDKQIENLSSNGINNIYVVTGYKSDVIESHLKEKFEDLNITIIHNNDYDKTNNMYSLNMAKEYLKNECFIMMNSDVFFESNIIRQLINDKYEDLIVCEKDNYNDESMKIVVTDGVVSEISKQIEKNNAYGTSIDVYKFGQESANKLFNIINDYLYVKKDLNSWSEVAINDLLKVAQFKSLDTKSKWMEIDNLFDLEVAEKIFN